MKNSRSGFTIVELLIVIVVIAILATISIVAYSGIQQRASNTARIAAAKDWVKSIEAYIALNQAYPAALNTYCLGESNAIDFDGNPDVDCGVSNNIKHNSSGTTSFNNNLKTLTPALPAFPSKPVQITATTTGSGMLLRGSDTYDPTGENVAFYPTLIFFLEGANQDCVLQPLATAYAGGNFVKTTAKNSFSDVGTGCRVMLPDPRNL